MCKGFYPSRAMHKNSSRFGGQVSENEKNIFSRRVAAKGRKYLTYGTMKMYN